MEKGNRLVEAVVKGLQDKKGRDIVVADLTGVGDTVCKYFVVCTGGSPAQVAALARSAGDAARETARERPLAVAGLERSMWVAMDYADVMVHILLPEQRDFYDLEHLWADAALTRLPDTD